MQFMLCSLKWPEIDAAQSKRGQHVSCSDWLADLLGQGRLNYRSLPSMAAGQQVCRCSH